MVLVMVTGGAVMVVVVVLMGVVVVVKCGALDSGALSMTCSALDIEVVGA